MATYRPKKLEELNSVYDKSLEAERAIKKSSDIITDNESAVSDAVVHTQATGETAVADVASGIDTTADISEIANDFILRFGTPERAAATTKLQETESIKARVKHTTAYQPVVKSVTAGTTKKAITETAQSTEDTIAVAEPTIRKVTSQRAELMNDYMRVMNDEDDDTPFYKRSRNKKNKKGKKKRHSEDTVISQDATLSDEISSNEDAADLASQESDDTIVALEDTEAQEDVAEDISVQETEDSFDAVSEEASTEEVTEEDEAADEEQESVDIYSSSEAKINGSVKETTAIDTDIPESEDDINTDELSSDAEEVKQHGKKKEKPVKRHIFAKLMLTLLLIAAVVSAAIIGCIKLWLAVDTGTLVGDSYYFFTADSDYTFADVKNGDFIISENIPPETGSNFVYIDTLAQGFRFAKHTGTYVNNDGDVLFTAETENSRVGIYRDDARGVIIKTIPEVGKYIALVCEYYVVLISVFLALALAIILILALAFKRKDDSNDIEVVYDDEDASAIDEDTDSFDEDDDDIRLFDEI